MLSALSRRDVPIPRKNDAMKTKPTRYELDLNNLPHLNFTRSHVE
jgi:hypothetical protein